MTLTEAKNLTAGAVLHYTGRRACSRAVGPRGGVKESITRARVNGAVKTWKRDAARVQVPIKHGLYEYTYITENNLEHWHVEASCPLA